MGSFFDVRSLRCPGSPGHAAEPGAHTARLTAVPRDPESEHCLPTGWSIVRRGSKRTDDTAACPVCGQLGHGPDQPRECVRALEQRLDQTVRTGRRLQRQLALLEAELHRVAEKLPGSVQLERALDMVEETSGMAAGLARLGRPEKRR